MAARIRRRRVPHIRIRRVPGPKTTASPLATALSILETEVGELTVEIRRLKEKARLMESENKALRRRLAVGASVPGAPEDNLLDLYRDGFHVCQLYFGQRLEGGCLFCVALLQRRRS